MKTQLKIGAACALFLTVFSGCKDMTPGEAADSIGRELEVSFQYRATDDDTCARQQIFALLNEYSDFNAAAKQAVKTALKSQYKTVVLHATRHSGAVENYQSALFLMSGGRVLEKREYASDRKVVGKEAQSLVAKDAAHQILELGRESMNLRNHGTHYTTTSPWFFNQLLTEQAAKDVAPMTGIPVERQAYDDTTFKCSDIVKLNDLL